MVAVVHTTVLSLATSISQIEASECSAKVVKFLVSPLMLKRDQCHVIDIVTVGGRNIGGS